MFVLNWNILFLKKCFCGSVVEHCVSSAKGCGFNSQGTHTDNKCIICVHCKLLWIKASAKCINVNLARMLAKILTMLAGAFWLNYTLTFISMYFSDIHLLTKHSFHSLLAHSHSLWQTGINVLGFHHVVLPSTPFLFSPWWWTPGQP